MSSERYRILIADDTPALHDAYSSIFNPVGVDRAPIPGADKFAPELARPETTGPVYDITYVNQGEEALAAVNAASLSGAPFALAILDVRMPPGIDGVQTARHLRSQHSDLQIVLCTAYADYSWSDLLATFAADDGVMMLKKPFDAIEVQQLAITLCRKWRLGAENRALVRDLENRVAARTEQLAITLKQLEVALTAAKSADRAKHNFLRCVSHELNTPLNGVHGPASVLALSKEPEVREMSRLILESSARLNRLFARILLYLQLEAPATTLLTSASPADLVARAVEPHRATAVGKGLTLNCTVNSPPLLRIIGKFELLIAAVDNLVENAVKFTDKGGIQVRLRYDESARFLVMDVTDTGPGIAQPKLDEITALFSPGDDSLTRKQDGLGIGLALVSRIARHLGGSITAGPGLTQGTQFSLAIPAQLP